MYKMRVAIGWRLTMCYGCIPLITNATTPLQEVMGYYRFFLALCVALSHYEVRIGDFNPGPIAVVSFMLLSGYVMTLLVTAHYDKVGRVPYFYCDRLCRLLPQFMFYSLLIFALMKFTPLGTTYMFLMDYKKCSAENIALNFTLFGNIFYRRLMMCTLIPASWSLGLEAVFYLIIPWLILVPFFAVRVAAIVISVLTLLCAFWGVADFDLYAFRYPFGTLHIFLAGAAIARPDLFGKYTALAVWLLSIALMEWALAHPTVYSIFQLKDVLAGVIIGIPTLRLISKKTFSPLDELLGNISYGMFLNHYLFKWLGQVYLNNFTWNWPQNTAVIVASVTLSAVTYYLIERPALRLRRRLRNTAPSSA